MKFPSTNRWVTSPLRNNIKIELNALVNDVWMAIANPMDIFSNCCGVNHVESIIDDLGNCSEYTTYYESENSSENIAARSTMVWYEPNQGWASLDDYPHPMGFEQSLIIITVEKKENKSILNWSMHYDIENNEMLQIFIKELDQSLKKEVSRYFIQKLGGRII